MGSLKKITALILSIAIVLTMFAGAAIKTDLSKFTDSENFTEAQKNALALVNAVGVIEGIAENEIGAAGIPCILIPSPNVTHNHQEKNARVLESGGGAVVILEKDCTPEKLYSMIRQLLADPDRRAEMSRRLRSQVKMDSTQRICDIVEELAAGK